MPKAKPRTIAAYIEAAPPIAQPHLRELYAILKEAAPDAREAIKWSSPVFEENRILFAFAAYKTHLNFMPTLAVIDAFAKDLEPYKTGMGSIQFPYDQRLPKMLIRKLAKRRIKELRENDAKWM